MFNLLELFPAFICANNIGNLVNSLFGVGIFNPVPVFLGGFNSALTAIAFSGSNCTSSLASNGGVGGKSSSSLSKYKSIGKF